MSGVAGLLSVLRPVVEESNFASDNATRLLRQTVGKTAPRMLLRVVPVTQILVSHTNQSINLNITLFRSSEWTLVTMVFLVRMHQDLRDRL